MEMRKLGRFEVSLCGLGCNNFGARLDEPGAKAVVDAALETGVTFFDTADIYGGGRSEEFLGRALGARRDDVVIATKFGMQMGDDPARKGGSARWVAQACEESLRRLGTDRIDLYQFHAPDGDTPVDETLEALDRLVRDGKVLEIGCSNFTGELIDASVRAPDERGVARWVSVQNHHSLLARDDAGALAACERYGLGYLPYFPLASGLLTGKYRRGEAPPPGTRLAGVPEERRAQMMGDERFAKVEALETFARERGHTLLELAMSWLAANPLIPSVIAGATKPEQVRANAAAVSAWEMGGEEKAGIDQITRA